MKVVLDTSVWVDFFKFTNVEIEKLLSEHTVLMHDFIFGELLIGGLSQESEHFYLLQKLPKARTADDLAVHRFIMTNKIRSVGYVDCHLLYSCYRDGSALKTLDKSLSALFKKLTVTY